MKRFLLTTFLAFIAVFLFSMVVSAQWKPAGDRIKTVWAEKVDPADVLPEYPRPIMERAEWMNLNGLWDYSIVGAGTAVPENHDGRILVPFCVESSLSGVMKEVGQEKEVWYEREFTVPASWKGRNVLLHFGAVDFRAEVWINDVKVGMHEGGYEPFSFDLTPLLKPSGAQNLKVLVWDPVDMGHQATGKQRIEPEGIWYTAVTGIWQTVWLEPVASVHIKDIKITPDLDRSLWTVSACVEGAGANDIVEVTVLDKGAVVSKARSVAGQTACLGVKDPELWSPESPYLYDVEIVVLKGGKAVDRVKSYCAMRKISARVDGDGVRRMQLNDRDYFQFGPLDQGWWPDGLYTAPTDEALVYDIVKTKEMGFNMIRKHVKVEPARWYTHCDRLGMLVWQDMPSGDLHQPSWQNHYFYEYQGGEFRRSEASESLFRREWKGIMDFAHNYPSIVVWVPFNEGWGQFKTADIARWTGDYDPSRLVNAASGGNFFPNVGDIMDLHNYPQPRMYLYDARQVLVMGEYGGIGLALDGHLWWNERNWGYVQFKSEKEATDEYVRYAGMLKGMVPYGFSGAVYTQTTDVEGEVNGLMTYDRKVVKLDPQRVREANREVINTLNNR